MSIREQNVFKERATGAEDHFMSSYLQIINSGKSYISEVLVIPKIFKAVWSFGLKIICLLFSREKLEFIVTTGL